MSISSKPLNTSHKLSSTAVAAAEIILAAGAILLRILWMDYQTLDYVNFLSQWVRYFRDNGGFAALSGNIGNYNIPYLVFLALFSYIPVNDLYLIKILSCLFDFLLAFACGRLCENCGGKGRAAFFIVLLLPTVVVNSSLWAQCDSSYTAFAVLGLALALEKNPSKSTPYLSMVCFAASFAFKLQAVFILPVCLVLLMVNKYRLRHFIAFPLTYILMVLPAVIAGRPFADTIMLYFDQAESVGSAPNYNSPSLTALTQSIDSSTLIIFAFAAMFALLLLAWMMRKKLSNLRILIIALLMSTLIPFLLPHMHDRYFYIADVLSVVLACCIPAAFGAAVCQQFASLICYIAYLKTYYIPFGGIYLTNDRGAVAVIIAVLIESAAICADKENLQI